MSPGGVLFWAKCVQDMDDFISSKRRSMLELAALVPVKAPDPFLRIKKKLGPFNLETRKRGASSLEIIEADLPTNLKEAP